ncbi:hypothetical protein GPK62_11975 [Faecalibacterium prausnitzii]|uniref:restriction endonuclease subunit S n=1 Tax=Faecalibacterium prausnitzii TaxID=853 RepID=UPI001C02F11D|nr:hypothetical protein [Faecalibacterium prausnitzii]
MQALYAAWFIDCIPFGGIKPSSWQKTSIYTIADIIYGAPFSSKQFNTDGKGIPIIRIRDLKEQKVATYTTEKHPKGYLLQAGDIVVGMDGEFVPYIWGSDEAWLNQRVCVFKNKRLKGKAFLILQSNLFYMQSSKRRWPQPLFILEKRILMRLKSHCQTLECLTHLMQSQRLWWKKSLKIDLKSNN